MEFLRSLLRRHLAEKPGGVGQCWLFSQATYSQDVAFEEKPRAALIKFIVLI